MTLLQALLSRRLAQDEREARGLIMAGRVSVEGTRRDKPSFIVPDGAAIQVAPRSSYVSRGGFKLEGALRAFSIDLRDKVCADIGSSTGGFTDCMLKNGAKKVYAVDVGYGLLDWTLRSDPRVVTLERVNARRLTPALFGERCHFASIDVSFISLRLIFPALFPCLAQGAQVVALIKPQFEAPRAGVGKGGIVRDPAVRGAAIRAVRSYAREAGFLPLGVSPSPITGADGNVEFLLLMQKPMGK